MNNIFGVNSHASANLRLKNGYTMYDWVMRKRCFPAFWGRTFLGENAITTEEIEQLRKKNCKIALIIRDLTEQQISQHSGVKDAMRVVAAAKALGVPQNKGIALFVEVKPEWCINHNWMISFARNLANNGYVAGFIGNTDSSVNPVFGRQCSHFVQATEFEKQCGAIFVQPSLNERRYLVNGLHTVLRH